MDDLQTLIDEINEGYREIDQLRAEHGVKPGESLMMALTGKPLFPDDKDPNG